jgi:DNA-binding winged helix-turn-helix (wHTH) protein
MLEQKQQIYVFDDFRLDVPNRELSHDGQVVALPAKAFDMLVVLIENRGRLIEKEELFQRVWPDQIVEESNLTVQVSAIRRALGDRKANPQYILTITGKGYRFVGELISQETEDHIIEHHSITRVAVESERLGDPVEPLVEQRIDRTDLRGSGTLQSFRKVSRPAMLLAGLLIIAVTLGIVFFLRRTRSTESSTSTAIKSIAVPFDRWWRVIGTRHLNSGWRIP